MPSITKPLIPLIPLPKNELGLTDPRLRGRDVDPVRGLRPRLGHRRDQRTRSGSSRRRRTSIAKLSGIGCSSKTPTYFVRGAHGFNCAHGRMATIATGANAANRELTYIGISGDGDSLSIGLGHLVHAIRRNVNMVYVIENNGVYGLTKGQLSASADIGSTPEEGRGQPPGARSTRSCSASALGATFLARSFSGRQGAADPDPEGGGRPPRASR